MSDMFARITADHPEFKLDAPPASTDKVVVFLPGISGGAFSERFQPLVDACLNVGFAVARLNIWKDSADVEQKNLGEIYKDLGEITTHLHNTYPYMFGIGKSFGGAIMLTFPSVYISKKVLWAPAIGVIETGANIEAYMTAKLGTTSSLLDIQIDRTFLQQKENPTLIIHGTADENIPFSNSEQIVSMLPNASLVPIKGADHSYRDKEHETAVIKATVDFFTSDPSTSN